MEKVNKWMALMIAGAVAAIAFLFLPFISENAFSINVWDIITEGSDGMPATVMVSLVLAIGGSVATAVTGYLKNRTYALAGSIAGLVGILASIGTISEETHIEVMDYAGMGIWISLIAIIAAIVFAVKAKED